MKKDTAEPKVSFMNKLINGIEKVGNKFPHPFLLFGYFIVTAIIVSVILSLLDVSAIHPTTGETIEVLNLLSNEGIQIIFSSLVTNFTGFAPLGQVLVMMFAIGIMEQTGLLANVLSQIAMTVPKKLITPVLILISVLSTLAGHVGYVVIIPLGAALFASMGRHPIAGLAAAFSGVAGGFGANLLVTPDDAMLGVMSEVAAHTIDPSYAFNILGNWFFMIISTFLVVIIGTYVTEKIVVPRLGEYKGEEKGELRYISIEEKRAMKWTGVALLLTGIALFSLVIPTNAPLRGINADTGYPNEFLDSVFIRQIVPVLFFLFLIPGIVYGKLTKQINKGADVVNMFVQTAVSLAPYIALAFMAGQFVALFNASELGAVISITVGNFLYEVGFTGIGLILTFMLVTWLVNFIMGSALAQWALFAPIFVPMFMQLGYTPEFTQVAYRVADSVGNITSPLLSYFPLILTFVAKYDKEKAGVGNVLALMSPYAILLAIFWTLLLIAFMVFNLPIGPGSQIFMP